ncbi:MAG TPA: Hsp70 family protein [Actinophytocola sp.]|uniref:Hsp70 family protein n=1 Tax=Actinophytocola sp. TaxID=1872138 RepID=UPI002DDC96D8|nr:Hsp70 family protein [Actinophytocola sp.]HEV2779178.1 Hsp70 family protein [Actinophytocola sp.]
MRQVTAVVDFGTSHTVVVVSGPGVPARLVFTDGAPWFPSAVFWGRDGRAVVGADAVRLARSEPARLERHPKARIGEQEVLLGDSVVPTTSLVRVVLSRAVAEASRAAGAPVQHLVLTHPADWGSIRLGALMTAAQGLAPRLSTVPEPVGAAAWYATRHELPVGATLAVLDFGGGTCDAAVVRREPTGLSVVECAGLPDLGGEDLDQRLVEYIRAAQPVLAAILDAAEQTRPVAAAELSEIAYIRENVRAAKEVLSREQQVEVRLPGGLPEMLLTRQELEARIRPDLARAVELVAGALRSCGLSAADLSAVHLVGGSSRIPLLAQLLRARLPVPVRLDDQPQVVVALGAHAVVEPAGAGEPGSPGRPGEPGGETDVTSLSFQDRQPDGPVPTRRTAAVIASAAVVVAVAATATIIGTGLFDRRVTGSPTIQAGSSAARLSLPAPPPGRKVENPGHATDRLTEIRAGESVAIRNQFGAATQWRLDSFADSETDHRQLVELGNPERPGYRWILVRVTETLREAAPRYQPARTYVVDDRGLMIKAYDGVPLPALPAGCPKEFPATDVPAGTAVPQCLLYQVSVATPIAQVAVASLSHSSPTNLKVKESIENGGRVAVTGRSPAAPPGLPADALPLGAPAAMRHNTFTADVAVVDVIEDASGYFKVEYSNDEVIALPGSRAVVVRIAARLTEPIDGEKLPLPTIVVQDDRGAEVTSPFRAGTKECTPLGPTGKLTGTVLFCAVVALPLDTPLRSVEVQLAPGAEAKTWRLR